MLGHVIAQYPIAASISMKIANPHTPHIKIYRDNMIGGTALKVQPSKRIIKPMRG